MRMNRRDQRAIVDLFHALNIPLAQMESRVEIRDNRVVALRLTSSSSSSFWARGRRMTAVEQRIVSDRASQAIVALTQLEELMIYGYDELVSLSLSGVSTSQNKNEDEEEKTKSSLTSSVLASPATSLSKLRGISIHYCSNLQHLTLPTTNPHLTHLSIMACPRVVLDHIVTQTFEYDASDNKDDDDEDDEENKRLIGRFPVLSSVWFRRNNIDNIGFARLWTTLLCHCPKLMYVDVSHNNISSLSNLVVAMKSTTTTTTTTMMKAQKLVPQKKKRRCHHQVDAPTLRELNLNQNPILCHGRNENPQISQQQQQHTSSAHASSEICHHQQQTCLKELLHLHPRLTSIVQCADAASSYGARRKAGDHVPVWNCMCFRRSSLYTPKIQHLMDLNHTYRGCSGGRDSSSNNPTGNQFTLSVWPYIMSRATRTLSSENGTLLCVPNTNATDNDDDDKPVSAFDPIQDCQRRKASIIYTLLQGPAFASAATAAATTSTESL